LTLDLYATDEAEGLMMFTPEEEWFFHLRLEDLTTHAEGESLDYAITVELCSSFATLQ
jgi:hypothetical protein